MSSLVETHEYQAFLRFIELKNEYREVTARARELEATIKAMQPSLVAYLAEANLKSLTLNNHLISTRRVPWVYPLQGVSKQQVIEALKIAGLGRMVRESYSTESLTAYIKQLEEHARLVVGLESEGEDERSTFDRMKLHPALRELLTIKPAYSLTVRKKEDPYAKSAKTQTRYQDEGDEIDDDDD